jgi:hypothetical protein
LARGRANFSQKGRDGVLNARGFSGRRVTLSDLALGINQKLGEVPLDSFSSKNASRFPFKKLVERVSLVAVDVNLRK